MCRVVFFYPGTSIFFLQICLLFSFNLLINAYNHLYLKAFIAISSLPFFAYFISFPSTTCTKHPIYSLSNYSNASAFGGRNNSSSLRTFFLLNSYFPSSFPPWACDLHLSMGQICLVAYRSKFKADRVCPSITILLHFANNSSNSNVWQKHRNRISTSRTPFLLTFSS